MRANVFVNVCVFVSSLLILDFWDQLNVYTGPELERLVGSVCVCLSLCQCSLFFFCMVFIKDLSISGLFPRVFCMLCLVRLFSAGNFTCVFCLCSCSRQFICVYEDSRITVLYV